MVADVVKGRDTTAVSIGRVTQRLEAEAVKPRGRTRSNRLVTIRGIIVQVVYGKGLCGKEGEGERARCERNKKNEWKMKLCLFKPTLFGKVLKVITLSLSLHKDSLFIGKSPTIPLSTSPLYWGR